MSLPPYPPDSPWERVRWGAVLFVLAALLFGQRPVRRVVAVEQPRPAARRYTPTPEPAPVRPWAGCCLTPPEL